jgi:hypothetical protein
VNARLPLLAPKASAARGIRIAAEVNRGAYASIVDQPMDRSEPVACYRDGAGAPVRWPLAAEYPIVPLDDAKEPCPACGAVVWEE